MTESYSVLHFSFIWEASNQSGSKSSSGNSTLSKPNAMPREILIQAPNDMYIQSMYHCNQYSYCQTSSV